MKAVVLSSGGVDSTTCLAMAVHAYGPTNVVALSVMYGQKHKKELEQSTKIAQRMGIRHETLDLSPVFKGVSCCLLAGSDKAVPHGDYAEQQKKTVDGVVDTYVPFRNGLLVSAACSFAMGLFPDEACVEVWIGAHADDAAGNAYPDCSLQFLEYLAHAVEEGTAGHVRIMHPLAKLNKAGVVCEGLKLNAPYDLTWSCYEGGDRPCGECGTCIDRAKAFAANGVQDPALAGS